MSDLTGRGTTPPEHHGQPMRYRGSHTTWQGEFEIEDREWACVECRSNVRITTREHVGPVQS